MPKVPQKLKILTNEKFNFFIVKNSLFLFGRGRGRHWPLHFSLVDCRQHFSSRPCTWHWPAQHTNSQHAHSHVSGLASIPIVFFRKFPNNGTRKSCQRLANSGSVIQSCLVWSRTKQSESNTMHQWFDIKLSRSEICVANFKAPRQMVRVWTGF